jgi:hypothetical protein
MSARAELSRTLAGKQVQMRTEDGVHDYSQHFDQRLEGGSLYDSERFSRHLTSNKEVVSMFGGADSEEDTRHDSYVNHVQTYAHVEQQHFDADLGDKGASDFSASEVREYLRDLLEATDRIEERIQSAVDDAVKVKTRENHDDEARATQRPAGANSGDYSDSENQTSVHVSAHESAYGHGPVAILSNTHQHNPANTDEMHKDEVLEEAAGLHLVSPRTLRAKELRHMLLDE